jgi:hypothetical protein
LAKRSSYLGVGVAVGPGSIGKLGQTAWYAGNYQQIVAVFELADCQSAILLFSW